MAESDHVEVARRWRDGRGAPWYAAAMRRLYVIAATVLPFTACASQGPRPTGVDPVERCGEVLTLAENIFPTDRYRFVAEHCVAPMLSEPSCRAAVMQSLDVSAAERNRLVAGACTRAYCSELDGPAPKLCTTDWRELPPSQMLPLGMEFFGAVRRYELGEKDSKRWDETIGRPPQVADAPTPEPPKPAPKPSDGPKITAKNTNGAVHVRLVLEGRDLVIHLGDRTWKLTDKPAGGAFDPAAEEVLALDGRSAQVIVELGPGIEYHHLVGMLNALGVRGVKDIAIRSSDQATP